MSDKKQTPMQEFISELKYMHSLLPVESLVARGQLMKVWGKIEDGYLAKEKDQLDFAFCCARLSIAKLSNIEYKNFNEFYEDKFSSESKDHKHDKKLMEVAIDTKGKKYHFTPWDILKYPIKPAAKPPLGLKPKRFHDESRFLEVSGAIDRYFQNNRPIPVEWVEEYNYLTKILFPGQ
jgi:hypothetical protein